MVKSNGMEILFEDSRFIAVAKPSGIPSQFQENSQNSEKSAEEQVQQQYGKENAFLLHRLDNGTSGVLMFAKNEHIYQEMRDKFKLREVGKFYLAWSSVTELPWQKKDFPIQIDLPLAHHPKSKKRMVALPENKKISHRGKPLAAHTIILSAHATDWLGLASTEFEIEIKTGVMHQIRVHLQQLGFPLWGDLIYGTRAAENTIAFPRLGLHAKKIEFTFANTLYSITAPFSDEVIK